MKTSIQVLGSTSAGNSTLIWNEHESIMIDCGFSPRYTRQQLALQNLTFGSITGLLLTHVHTDHVNPSMFSKLSQHRVPVFCHEGIKRTLTTHRLFLSQARHVEKIRSISLHPFCIGSFTVQAFEVPHDSAGGCFGYSLSLPQGGKITLATDLGYPDAALLKFFVDSDVIIIESNHDPVMLEESFRPQWLKHRIREIGHLSNDQCAEFLNLVLRESGKKPRAIVLAHISQECNTNFHAVKCIEDMLKLNGYRDIEIVPTFQRQANKIIRI
jgi:phosphoribosyl 1,2-cyclic phosphodiesterase